MIKKIFCYSDEVAIKRCGTKSLKSYAMLLALFIVLALMSLFLLAFNIPFLIGMIPFFMLFIIAIYYEVKLVLSMNDKMSAIAVDENGGLYKVSVIDRGVEFGLLGLSAGNFIKKITNNDLLKEVSSAVGLFFMFKQMNKAVKVMQNPNNVAMIINKADEFTGVITQKIIKIYNVENKKNKMVINCDFEIYKKGKIKQGKKIVLKKKYNNFEEIENMLGVNNRYV